MKKLGLLTILVVSAMQLIACGGGDGTTGPELPPINTPIIGGDRPTPIIFGEPDTPFAAPPDRAFNNLRGIAVSSRFVYIADEFNVHMYRSNGSWVNSIDSPYGASIQGIALIPEDLDLGGAEFTIAPPVSPYAGSPVILHDPVALTGYVTLLPPNLDRESTIEDAGNIDLTRFLTFPLGGDQIAPPDIPPLIESPPWIAQETIDVAVDPFGSILVTSKVLHLDPIFGLGDVHSVESGIHWNDPPRWHVGLQVFNRFNDYALEDGGGMKSFHKGWDGGLGTAIGYLGNLAVGSFALRTDQVGIPQYTYSVYSGDVFAQGDLSSTDAGNFLDYVGRTRITLSFAGIDPLYELEDIGVRPRVYDQVFGLMFGQTFSPFPGNPANPGGPLDPDLTNGGPSGMFIDPQDGSFYICDPGHDRILVYEGLTNTPTLPEMTNFSQSLKEIYGPDIALEPSEIMVDQFGRTFIIDSDVMRTLPGQTNNTVYGNIGGTVRHLQFGFPLVGDNTVTISDAFFSQSFPTDINGDYLVENIPYGQYLVTASRNGFENDLFVATIVPGQTIRVDLNLSLKTSNELGEYRGIVSDAQSNVFLADVTVALVGYSGEAVTDVGGNFALIDLAEGTYQAIFTKEGYVRTTMDLVITKGEITFHPAIFMDREPAT